MDTILIITGLLVVGIGVVIYFVKAGKIADRDGDLIPDVVEDGIGSEVHQVLANQSNGNTGCV